MGSSGSAPDITQDDILDIFSALDDPSAPLTTTEVVADLESPKPPARTTLENLEDDGFLHAKEIADADYVWWLPNGQVGPDQQAASIEFSAFVSAVQDYAILSL